MNTTSQPIRTLTRQIPQVAGRIESLVDAIAEGNLSHSGVNETYTPIFMDELEHVQMMVLKLTELMLDYAGTDQNADENGGSVFQQGELDYAKEDSDDEFDPETQTAVEE